MREIYKNKRVLITGHSGFKGSWLSLWLTELGAKVIGYSQRPPTNPSLVESVGDKITHITGDVRDGERLITIFEKHQPEFVFHLAAQPLVRRSYEEPRLTYEINVMGTVNVLEAVRKTKGVKACIIVSSDKCYENREQVIGYKETDVIGGYDPYSSSKGCAELVASAYRRSFFTGSVALSSVRAGNVIGGGDWAEDRIIPDCIRALSKGENIGIRSPSAIRPWQYVLEPLAGYLLLGALMYKDEAKYSGQWNFGSNAENTITVEELVRLIIKHWGSGTYTIDTSIQPHEASLLKLDTSKAQTQLGWKQVYDVYEAVERTTNWYKRFQGGAGKEELSEFTINEILEYTHRMGTTHKVEVR